MHIDESIAGIFAGILAFGFAVVKACELYFTQKMANRRANGGGRYNGQVAKQVAEVRDMLFKGDPQRQKELLYDIRTAQGEQAKSSATTAENLNKLVKVHRATNRILKIKVDSDETEDGE